MQISAKSFLLQREDTSSKWFCDSEILKSNKTIEEHEIDFYDKQYIYETPKKHKNLNAEEKKNSSFTNIQQQLTQYGAILFLIQIFVILALEITQ